MAGTTNIADLPLNPQAETNQNVVLETTENVKITNESDHLMKQRSEEDITHIAKQKQMNQLISGIQAASASGATDLPTRDIPMNPNALTSDEQIQPNFIPQAPSDYISQHETSDEILRQHEQEQNRSNTLDSMYDELQIPLFIGLLYFLFQLPFFRSSLFKLFPSLFGKDGNPNLLGFIFQSIIFALIYYISNKGMNYLSEF